MHIELFNIRFKLISSEDEYIAQLCFEVGETDEDRKELIANIKKALDEQMEGQAYKILGYHSRVIRPQED
jgi:hypothetical protein